MKENPLQKILIILFGFGALISSLQIWGQDTVSIQRMKRTEIDPSLPQGRTFFIENFYYNDDIYSKGKKTQLGDNSQLNAAIRYQYSEKSFFRTRFSTYPEENRFNNKTSKFELLAGHTYETLTFQIDLQINTNDEDSSGNETGGTSIGLDLDSEFSRIDWALTDNLKLTFYPFNFDGEVGVEFNTWDVTRMYFIDGAQASFTPASPGTTKIAQKTIPGLQLTLGDKRLNAYIGLGLATYLSPTNPDFDITNNTTAIRWERKENIGHKLGLNFISENTRLWFGAVGHTKSDETGSLLKAAASLYGITKFKESGITLEAEGVVTKAGKKAWRLNSSGTWFEQTTYPGYYPIYSDYNGNHQNWLGKTDFALNLRVGYDVSEDFTPYGALRYQGKNFIYGEDESAHLLRTADESQSHGGLYRAAIGSLNSYGNFIVNPEIELRKAKNPVFTNAADAINNSNYQGQRLQAKFSKDDIVFKVNITYSFDGSKPFTP